MNSLYNSTINPLLLHIIMSHIFISISEYPDPPLTGWWVPSLPSRGGGLIQPLQTRGPPSRTLGVEGEGEEEMTQPLWISGQLFPALGEGLMGKGRLKMLPWRWTGRWREVARTQWPSDGGRPWGRGWEPRAGTGPWLEDLLKQIKPR